MFSKLIDQLINQFFDYRFEINLKSCKVVTENRKYAK